MITYTCNVDSIGPEQLSGFFEGWPNHPSPQKHLEILQGSYKSWLAMDGQRCVGFINAISDGILSAFIPLLEVLPEYRGDGIGSELIRQMEASLAHIYSLDIVCDDGVANFYQGHGFSRLTGMAKRQYGNQTGS